MAHSLSEAQCRLFTLYQRKDITYQDYLEIFTTTVTVFYYIGATGMGTENTLTELLLKKAH